jgi:hypothetical protein
MNYQERSYTVDRWITANVSSCIDFYGIEINKYRVAIITIAVIGLLV